MKCPMVVSHSYGIMQECETKDCAWWDASLNQCCIKTMSIVPILVNETPKATSYRSWADEMLTKFLHSNAELRGDFEV